jgi:hypothetical protein
MPILFKIEHIVHKVYPARQKAEVYKGGKGKKNILRMGELLGKNERCKNYQILRPLIWPKADQEVFHGGSTGRFSDRLRCGKNFIHSKICILFPKPESISEAHLAVNQNPRECNMLAAMILILLAQMIHNSLDDFLALQQSVHDRLYVKTRLFRVLLVTVLNTKLETGTQLIQTFLYEPSFDQAAP